MKKTFALDERRIDRLRTLTEVSRALTYTTSIEEVLDLAVQRAADLMGAEQALIMLTDADGLLAVRAAYGVDDDRVALFREPLNETLVHRLQGLLDYPSPDCFLSVPLVAQGEVTGLMATVRLAGEPITDDDEWLLSALGDQTAVALENARLTREVLQGKEERDRAAAAQGRAQATLSHELRSPLTAVQAYAALLLEGVLDPLTDRQREAVARIRLSGDHLLAVIENVLDMGRINAGILRVKTREVRVADVVGEAVQMLHSVALEKEQDLATSVDGDLMVQADPHRLRQALVNLVGNAIKYTPPRGAIRIEVQPREWAGRPVAAIAVTDNGRGIPTDAVATIFEPYDRGGVSDPVTGLGLGLFIARELIRQMGGDVHVESQPGVGSTFTALVPLAASPVPERP
jgi:phosphoserine phosphatase RsbU/P